MSSAKHFGTVVVLTAVFLGTLWGFILLDRQAGVPWPVKAAVYAAAIGAPAWVLRRRYAASAPEGELRARVWLELRVAAFLLLFAAVSFGLLCKTFAENAGPAFAFELTAAPGDAPAGTWAKFGMDNVIDPLLLGIPEVFDLSFTHGRATATGSRMLMLLFRLALAGFGVSVYWRLGRLNMQADAERRRARAQA